MQQDITKLKAQHHRRFMKKGIAFAVASGICYGLYTAFLTLAETQGAWGAWFASEPWGGAPLSAFTVTFALAALNCAIGTVLGRILFKQRLEAHKVLGVLICLVAAGVIGGTSFANMGPEALFGCLFAFLAAFGWGFEGCVAGFGTILIDYRIGIGIRQITAGVLEFAIAFPVLAVIGDGFSALPSILSAAMTDPALLLFAVSGFFAMPAFSFWYKGNSMCGAALGMACNGMYAFWGPFFIWVLLGVLNVGGMSADYPPLSIEQWIGAVIMVLGIFCIAINPLDAFKKKEAVNE